MYTESAQSTSWANYDFIHRSAPRGAEFSAPPLTALHVPMLAELPARPKTLAGGPHWEGRPDGETLLASVHFSGSLPLPFSEMQGDHLRRLHCLCTGLNLPESLS